MRLTATVSLTLVLLAAGGARAQSTASASYGSAVIETIRQCETNPAIRCNGINSQTNRGIPVAQQTIAGGEGTAVDASLAGTGAQTGSSASAKAAFGTDLGLPELKLATIAGATTRVASTIYGFQRYTYAGPEEFDILLKAAFHIVDSSTDGGNGLFSNGARASAGFAIWDVDDFYSYFTPDYGPGAPGTATSIVNRSFLFGADLDCSAYDGSDPDFARGPRATSSTGGPLTGGEATLTLAQENCGEETLTIYPGEEFIVASYAQLVVNRGGFADATSTFTLGLDPAMGEANVRAFREGVAFDASAVPEPASWAMMLLGFGAIGGAVRRRRSHRLPAAA